LVDDHASFQKLLIAAIFIVLLNVKFKVVPVFTMKAYRENRGITVLNLSARCTEEKLFTSL
jgi:hypothetical protein